MKKLIVTLSLLASVCIICLASWYMVSFFPYLDKLNSISAQGISDTGKNRESLYFYAVEAESKQKIRTYAIESAYWSLVVQHQSNKPQYRVLNNIFWYMASHINFNNQEIFGIWVNCSLYGCGKGLKEAARLNYNREILELDKKELVSLAVLVRSPNIFKIGSKKSEERIKTIMEKKR